MRVIAALNYIRNKKSKTNVTKNTQIQLQTLFLRVAKDAFRK